MTPQPENARESVNTTSDSGAGLDVSIRKALHAITRIEANCDESCTEQDGWVGDAFVNYTAAADAVLAMPEMQAIRALLRAIDNDFPTWMLTNLLPENVREWFRGSAGVQTGADQ